MFFNGILGSLPIALSLRSGGLTFSLGHIDAPQVFSFDAAGRLWSAFVRGKTHRRGLNGRVLAKWTDAGGCRQRSWLSEADANALVDESSHAVGVLLEALERGTAQLVPRPTPALLTLLARAQAFDSAMARRDQARYEAVYKPIGILPPDQYLAVVVQITEGCSFNTCTFCALYRDRPFRIRRPEDVLAHAHAVRDYLAEGLALRRTIFLGDANALAAPMPLLVQNLRALSQVFDPAERGLYAFLDAFSGERKSADDYAELVALGLKRVYIGMESGNADLLRFLHKPGTPDDVLATVQALKAGGASVGVIVLIGAGSQRFAEAHLRDSAALLNAMPLDESDLIYASTLVSDPKAPYAQEALRAGIQPLSEQACASQIAQLRSLLRFTSTNAPRFSYYDIREFVY